MIKTAETILKNLDLKQSLSRDVVNIADKKRSNLFTWRGQFSPQLIEALIEHYAKPGDVLFDPFIGSGTLLLESARRELDVYGTELNPAAFGLANIYNLINVDFEIREQIIDEVEDIIDTFLPFMGIFNQIQTKPITELKNKLVAELNNNENILTRIVINALIIGLDFEQKKLDLKKLQKFWAGLKEKIRALPHSDISINLFLRDARKTGIDDSMIDLVITSPPYINVFNYHQNYRKSVEAIGYDVLSFAKSEIGSNRKFRSNRYLTVVQYSLDVFQVFQELKRICRPNAKIIFIVGRESSVKKTSFSNARILSEIACSGGFILEGQQPRVFKNKFGQDIYEEILRFSIKEKTFNHISIEAARSISVEHLKQAIDVAPKESIIDLKDAISKSHKVEPSKVYSNV